MVPRLSTSPKWRESILRTTLLDLQETEIKDMSCGIYKILMIGDDIQSIRLPFARFYKISKASSHKLVNQLLKRFILVTLRADYD